MNLSTLTQIGIAIACTSQGDLRLEAAPGVLTAEFLAQIAKYKPALLAELGWQREHVNLVNMDSYGQAVGEDADHANQELQSVHSVRSPEPPERALQANAAQRPGQPVRQSGLHGNTKGAQHYKCHEPTQQLLRRFINCLT